MQAHEMLLAARTQAGLSQSQAAARCHVSFSAYEKWERGAPCKAPMMAGLLLLLGAAPAQALQAAQLAAQE